MDTLFFSFFDHTKHRYVSPVVAYLASKECKDNGIVVEAGGGWFAKVRWQQSEGYAHENIMEVSCSQFKNLCFGYHQNIYTVVSKSNLTYINFFMVLFFLSFLSFFLFTKQNIYSLRLHQRLCVLVGIKVVILMRMLHIQIGILSMVKNIRQEDIQ